ncbi:hypothetical protein [Pseudomonas frederiksbergensis]|uniref:Uncharacterized protein n=1 Tax=Pseudomonas frederiksbergensis TaxID=104087 RepID=A0A0U1PQN3_9PSED|nr:hypothetical protein [Pseudomonas frederiksbergensis]KKK07934.1 hypothetical protein JZ00_30560 [Pseudomonas frederiksbergensis]
MSTTVVFDSNVWEQVADEAKRAVAPPTIQALHDLISMKAITPFFFEGIVNLEAIPKKARKAYLQRYKPSIKMSVDNTVEHESLGTPPAGIPEYLETTVKKAVALGFRFVHLPRIAAPRHLLADQYKAPEILPLQVRLDRGFECLRYIESLGCGKGALMAMLENPQNGLVPALQDDSITEKKFAQGVAEWMDGDALSATYAYGLEYFCTSDQGAGAGTSSIFHPSKRALYVQNYNVKIVTPDELLAILHTAPPEVPAPQEA